MRPAALVACLLLPALAAARPVRLEIVEAPPACPDVEAVAAAVARHLGRPGVTADAERRVVVRVAAAPGAGLEAFVRLVHDGRARGSRRLRSPQGDCAELMNAVALQVAFLVDPLVAPPPEPPPEPPSEPPGPSALDWAVGALGAGALGAGPTFTGGVGLDAALGWGAWGVGLDARHDLATATEHRGGTIDVARTTVGLRGCWRPGGWAACALLRGGARHASASGFDATEDLTLPVVAAGARGDYAWRLGRVHLAAFAEVTADLNANRLRVDDTVAWSADTVGATAGVVVGVGAPR